MQLLRRKHYRIFSALRYLYATKRDGFSILDSRSLEVAHERGLRHERVRKILGLLGPAGTILGLVVAQIS
jgi:hypothetical protein